MEIKFTDVDGFDTNAARADLAIIVFARAEVESGLVGSAVERLMLFSDDARHVRRFAGRVVLLFDGYNDDPRPLPQIRECVRFFRAVDRLWSYWLHFLVPTHDVLQLAVLLSMDVRASAGKSGAVGYALNEPMQLATVMQRWFTAMNTLHDVHAVDEAFNRAQTAALLKVVKGWA